MYTALLQNQVLGIDNPYLLHEIHNSDEIMMKGNLYTELQKQTLPEDAHSLLRESKKLSLLSSCG